MWLRFSDLLSIDFVALCLSSSKRVRVTSPRETGLTVIWLDGSRLLHSSPARQASQRVTWRALLRPRGVSRVEALAFLSGLALRELRAATALESAGARLVHSPRDHSAPEAESGHDLL